MVRWSGGGTKKRDGETEFRRRQQLGTQSEHRIGRKLR